MRVPSRPSQFTGASISRWRTERWAASKPKANFNDDEYRFTFEDEGSAFS